MNYIVYPGNKTNYIPKIHRLLNGRLKNRRVNEPFAGSGSFSLFISRYVKEVLLNEIDKNIFRIHYSFKNGNYSALESIIKEILSFGNPKEIKENYYTARNELNKKYFNTDSIEEGFYNWAISTFAINSLVRFGPNGFNQGWGIEVLIEKIQWK